MPVNLDKLRGTLTELEAELGQLDSVDDPTRQALARAHAEIAAALERGKRTGETANAENALQDRLAEFEASHPQLAGIVSRLLDGLAQLGI